MRNFFLCLLILLGCLVTADTQQTLINGEPVDPNDKTWHPVIKIKSDNGSGCTATVIGPRTLITAAHCGEDGEGGSFTYRQVEYRFKYERSAIYPQHDHDLALGYLDKEWPHAMATVIQGRPTIGATVTLLGYGCTNPGGGGGNDGILRVGDTTVTRFTRFDVVSSKEGGAALCFGDSGGPSYLKLSNGKYELWGVNSKGNIKDTNYNCHFGSDESKNTMNIFINLHGAKICGINKTDCDGGSGGDEFSFDNPMASMVIKDKPGGHNPQYIKRHAEMLMMYLETGQGIVFPDEDPVPRCACPNGEQVACNKKDFGFCSNVGSYGTCRCL